MNATSIRSHFPFIEHNEGSIYFDSAATSLKPRVVIDEVHEYLTKQSVNVHRGDYRLARSANRMVEDSRLKISKLVNAAPENVFFTSGATDANQILAERLKDILKPKDEILYAPDDHQCVTDVVKQLGASVKITPYGRRKTGDIDIADIKRLATPQTKVIYATHIHNVYGTDSDVHKLRQIVGPDCLVIVDCAQSVGHARVDLQTLDADVIFFSGHKMFADSGIGILACANDAVAMRLKLERNSVEKGTPHIAGILSLGAAADFIDQLSIESIHARLVDLTQYALNGLRTVPNIHFLPGMAHCACHDGYGIISFTIDNKPTHDVAAYLDRKGIMLRCGKHCIQDNSVPDALRMSLHVYNTHDEIDTLVADLKTMP